MTEERRERVWDLDQARKRKVCPFHPENGGCTLNDHPEIVNNIDLTSHCLAYPWALLWDNYERCPRFQRQRADVAETLLEANRALIDAIGKELTRARGDRDIIKATVVELLAENNRLEIILEEKV